MHSICDRISPSRKRYLIYLLYFAANPIDRVKQPSCHLIGHLTSLSARLCRVWLEVLSQGRAKIPQYHDAGLHLLERRLPLLIPGPGRGGWEGSLVNFRAAGCQNANDFAEYVV